MLTLQQMIDGVLSGAEGQALSKIAQAADEYVEDDNSKDSKGDGKAPPQIKREAERRAAQEEKAQGEAKMLQSRKTPIWSESKRWLAPLKKWCGSF